MTPNNFEPLNEHDREFLKVIGKSFFTTEVMDIIVGLHVVFNDYKEMSKWINTKNFNFGNYTPLELIFLGKGKKVARFVENACANGEDF